MGIVARQGFINSISSYLGIGLGFLNLIVLFAVFMEPEQLGLTRVLLAVSMIGYQVSQLGSINITLRYFPYFKDKEKGHNGFLFNILALLATGLGLVFLGYWIFEDFIVAQYNDQSPLFGDNFEFLYPLTGFLVLYFLLDRYLRSLLKSTFSQFLIDVVQRALTAVLIGAYALKWLNFEEFMLWWTLSYGVINACQLVYLAMMGELQLQPNFSFLTKDKAKEMLSYGLITSLANASQVLVTRIDVVLVGALIDLNAVAVYSIAVYMGTVVAIPGKSIVRVADTLIAEAWKRNDMAAIADLYSKTALNQLLVGLWILLGLGLNREAVFGLMKPEYAGGMMVMVYIAMAKLTDLASGINGRILVTSPYYRWDLYFNIALVAMVIITDVIFINMFGIDGAALATLVAVASYNLVKFIFLRIKYGLNPFDIRFGVLIVFAMVVWFGVSKIPQIGGDDTFGRILDIGVRGSVITLVYFPAVYYMKLSTDINGIVDKLLKHLKK